MGVCATIKKAAISVMNRIVSPLVFAAWPAFFLFICSVYVYANPVAFLEPEDDSPVRLSLSDAPLSGDRSLLLDIAFDTATMIPIEPHIKDRSRTQEDVIAACLELDQPERAFRYLKRIDNWRRGAAYADLALYCARKGDEPFMDYCLDRAQSILDETEDWRRDTIRVKVARVYAWLGENKRAKSYEEGVVESETGKADAIRAMKVSDDDFDSLVESLDAQIKTGVYDIVKNTLEAYAQLFASMYDDEAKRGLVEEKIKTSWGGMPIFVRIDLLESMAEAALSHNEYDAALAYLDDAKALVEEYEWPAEHLVPMTAELAELRYRAGEQDKAIEMGRQALALFNGNKEQIVNIYRARALRPLAEAFHQMGDEAYAASVYRQALDEGVENPNSRPRAEDLAATCASMALVGFEPDDELLKRIHQIHGALDHPW